MGAANHNTVEPSNVSMNIKRNRLVRDLEALECVSNVKSDGLMASNSVLFDCEGTMPGDIPVDVLRVLVDHDAFIPEQQPEERRRLWALINLE